MSELVSRQLSILPELDTDDVRGMLARGGLRDSSIKRYLGAARAWTRYCIDRGEPPHDARTDTLLRWLDWRVRQSQSPPCALRMSLAAARFVQRAYCAVHGVEAVPYTPQARVQLDAFGRTCTMNRQTQARARPLRLDELAALVVKVRQPRVTRGVTYGRACELSERDAAMLLVGWWGALRSDDIARLDWSEVHFAPAGVELHMRASKTTSATLALAARMDNPELCPARALQVFAAERGGHRLEGPVFGFTTGDHVGRRLHRLFVRCGVPRGYTSHSLRAGFATECASQGVPDRLVQQHGRWRSAQQHSEYVRAGRLWQDTPTTRLVCP